MEEYAAQLVEEIKFAEDHDTQRGGAIAKCRVCLRDYPKSLLVGDKCRPCIEQLGQAEADAVKTPVSAEILHEVMQRLACYDTPTVIVREINKQYSTAISLGNIKQYEKDPDCQRLIKDYRKKFLENIQDIPIVHKVVRLQRLEELFHQANEMGDVRRAVEVLAEARTEIEGKKLKIKTETRHSLLAIIGKFNGTIEEPKKVLQNRILERLPERLTQEAEVVE